MFLLFPMNNGSREFSLIYVPCMLTFDRKPQRVDDVERSLELFRQNKKDFNMQHVRMDQIWVHHYTPEPNRQSIQRTATGKSRLEKL